MNQCKDCKWWDKNSKGGGIPQYGLCKRITWAKKPGDVAFIDGGGVLYVLPTHGCNAWEAKGREE